LLLSTSATTRPVSDWIAVIDFGAQYSQLIARRVRECHVYCELIPHTTPLSEILARRPKGIILSGGPSSVYSPDAPRYDMAVYEQSIPVLGICYGMQLMAMSLGGKVASADKREYGRTRVSMLNREDLFAALEEEAGGGMVCWMSHGDHVEAAPPGFDIIATTENIPIAAMRNKNKRLYAVQFHPEVIHTPQGSAILHNFAVDICGCHPTWTMSNFIDLAVAEIREKVGSGRVLAALSGGVDSSVAAALVQRAVGDQLTCVFVNHGFMRKGEPEQVIATFTKRMGANFRAIDASQRFMDKLYGVSDPETKRKMIGEEFIRIFEEEAKKLGEIQYLVQGTLYPDVIESGTALASVIKSHHNVGGLPEHMELDLLEPLRNLFKDEVRELGLQLALPPEIVWRQPFPGPGLAIRVMGAITPERVEIARAVNAIVTDEIEQANLDKEVWQYFAVLTDTRTVGVVGDERTYGYAVAIRAVTAQDAMTADWARLPYELLDRMSSRIMNEVVMVSRVVYDISSKPPATIEWE
jgi:GMP synthase (glutamine-hydrolysing)